MHFFSASLVKKTIIAKDTFDPAFKIKDGTFAFFL